MITMDLIFEWEICFCMHPFKREGRKPFTMIQSEYRRRKSNEIIFLNHEKKEYYVVMKDGIYEWTSNDKHRLYFIMGDIFTVVHTNISKGLTKVPCCYYNPDYINKPIDDIINFLNLNQWKECKIFIEKSNIMDIVNHKIKTYGMIKK